jgi:hypothetical protein
LPPIFATRLSSFPLDFAGGQSGTVLVSKEDHMDRASLEPAIKLIIDEIHLKLDAATQITEVCAIASSLDEGIGVSMDIEQLIYEAGRLHDAASLLNRMRRIRPKSHPVIPLGSARCGASASGSA